MEHRVGDCRVNSNDAVDVLLRPGNSRFSCVVFAALVFLFKLPCGCTAESSSPSARESVRDGIARAQRFQRKWDVESLRASWHILGGIGRIRGLRSQGQDGNRSWKGIRGFGFGYRVSRCSEMRLQIWDNEWTGTTESPSTYFTNYFAELETRWQRIIPVSLSIIRYFQCSGGWRYWLGGGVMSARYKTRRSMNNGNDPQWLVFEHRGDVAGYEFSSGVTWKQSHALQVILEFKYLFGEEKVGYTASSVSGTYYRVINPGAVTQTVNQLTAEGWRMSLDGAAVAVVVRYCF